MKCIWVHALLQLSLSHPAALKIVSVVAKHELCQVSSVWWKLLLNIITIWGEAELTVFNYAMNFFAWWTSFFIVSKNTSEKDMYWQRQKASKLRKRLPECRVILTWNKVLLQERMERLKKVVVIENFGR